MSAPASLAAWATAIALPMFWRPSVRSTKRLAWPGGAVASPSCRACASWCRARRRAPAAARASRSGAAAGPPPPPRRTRSRPPGPPAASPATDWAAKRYALSRAARLTLSDTSSRNMTFRRSTQRGIVGLVSDEEQHREERAAQAERPAIAEGPRQPEPATGLAPPVEEPLDREQEQGQHDEERPQLALDRHRRRLGPRPFHEGRHRLRGQIRLVGVHQVHRDLGLAAARSRPCRRPPRRCR